MTAMSPSDSLTPNWSGGPGGNEASRTVETHTSVLVFLGDRVYKVKKAADLGFLDFRTREARHAACLAEVELNRRLAPDVYLGVAEVRGADGVPCEYLVAMRRMPDDRRLSTLVTHGADVEEALRDLARLLADFHSRCATSPEIARSGGPEVLRGLWREGLDALNGPVGQLLDPSMVTEVGELSSRYLDGRAELFVARQRGGLIRDGHGDLLADDIFCLDDGPRVLDCLEFDQRLRIGDVLGDVAFLAMDLERIGAAELARRFLDWYQEFSGETHPSSLEHFYVAYRAFVRCKVSCIRAGQGDPDAPAQARLLAQLTRDHLRKARVRLVLVGGLPGTGKSTLAEGLAAETGWTLLRSDVIRKELAGLEVGRSAAAPVDEGLYRPALRALVYQELLRRARSALARGETVVADASWHDAGERAAAADLASQTVSELIELCCTAAPEVALARIARRSVGRDASDADAAIYHHLSATMRPWPTATPVRTDVALDESLRAARAASGAAGLVVLGVVQS